MSLKNKIHLFYAFLVVILIVHTWMVYSAGYQQGKSMLISNPVLFLGCQAALFLVLLFAGFQLFSGRYRGYLILRITAFLLLAYGLVLAFGNIYRQEKVIGSYTGFFFVMIGLPLVLWISDYLKSEKGRS